MRSGIYQIENQVNGKRYIGSTVNLLRRQQQHFRRLRGGRHSNPQLQSGFNQYGEPMFAFSILENAKVEALIEREQHYLDTLKPEYNILLVAGSPLGHSCSPETRRKISEARKGMRFSEEHRRKISEALTGKPHPNQSHRHSEETKRKMSEAQKRRPPISAETRAKMSEAHRGKPLSEEHIRAMSRALTGRRFTKEHCRNLSEARKGKHHSEETRAKISESRKAYWRRVRLAKEGNQSRGDSRMRAQCAPPLYAPATGSALNLSSWPSRGGGVLCEEIA